MSNNFMKIRSGVHLGNLTSDPLEADSQDGMIYYNSVLKKIRKRENGYWVNVSQDNYAFIVGSGLIAWDAGTTSLSFTSDLFVERAGLDYSDNTIPLSLSPLVLPTTNHVAYIEEINVVPGGPDLVVNVDLISNISEGKIIIARRDGADLIFGVNRLSDGDSVKLYQGGTGGDSVYEQVLVNNQLTPAVLSSFAMNSSNERAAMVDYYVSRYHYDAPITEANADFYADSLTFAKSIGSGFNGTVRCSVVQTDEKILVGGDFTIQNGATSNRIIRLNADGTIDTSFVTGTGFNGTVYAIAIQSDGKILIGGDFTTYNGTASNRIIRLNSSGSIDATFAIGTGFNDIVLTLAVQSDGKILVGGYFTTYKGVVNNRIIRLDTVGAADATFVTGTGFNNIVYTLAVQSDGKILVGGTFLSYNGGGKPQLSRLNTNGTIDSAFNTGMGTGFSSLTGVRSISIQSDGKILVGGTFTTYNGISNVHIIRLNTDASADTSFITGTGTITTITQIAILSDGKILINAFDYNGSTYGGIIRLNTDGSADATFVTGTGFGNFVNTITIQSNGKILAGGTFTTYNGNTRYRLVKLDVNGSEDSTDTSLTYYDMFSDSSNQVFTISSQSDGKIVLGGSFITVKNTSSPRIVRLNTDYTVDTSFVTGAGLDGWAYSTSIQSDGKILVGGAFNSYNGTASNRIIRLNSDGSIDSSFVTGTGFNDIVYTLTAQSDGKILVGGNFTTYNGTTANKIIRLNSDGSIDSSFVIGTGFNLMVNKIKIQSDNKILVGGAFTTYNGTTSNRIIRLNSDGSIDSSFVIGTGFDSIVNTITIQPDNKILVGGSFSTYNTSTAASKIIRLNTDGSADATFVTGTGFNAFVSAIAIQSDGKILVGGEFTSYNGVTSNRIIRLDSVGTADSSFVTGAGFSTYRVLSLFIKSDGKILVGGYFTTYQGVYCQAFVSLTSTGSIDIIIASPLYIKNNFSGSAMSIAIQSDGKILVGGNFATHNGITSHGIMRLNLDYTKDIDFSYNLGTGFGSLDIVYSIAVQTDGKILVGGSFTAYNGITSNRIFRLNSNGSIDATFVTGTGFDNTVKTIIIQSDGKILIGGDFTTYNGTASNRIIRLNSSGSIDATFAIGTGFDSTVNAIIIQPDGKILAGGAFNSYNGTTANKIIRLNSDGSTNSAFVTGTGFNNIVNAIAIQSDGKILVGGIFTTYKGVTSNRIIRLNLDGSDDATFVTGAGFNNAVNTIAAQSDGRILIGGSFTTYKGTGNTPVIRLNTDGSADATFVTGTSLGNVTTITIKSSSKILVGGLLNFKNKKALRLALIDQSDEILNTLIKSGTLKVMYRPYGDTWELGGFEGAGDDVGVEFSIDSLGQAYYTTSNLSGTLVESFIRYKLKKL